jgi:hypothetical protein
MIVTGEERARLSRELDSAYDNLIRSKVIELGTEFKERKMARIQSAGLGNEETWRQSRTIESPLEVLHERALLAMRVLVPETKLYGLVDDVDNRLLLYQRILEASPYLWETKILLAASQTDVPSCEIRLDDVMPDGRGMWWSCTTATQDTRGKVNDAKMLYREGSELLVVSIAGLLDPQLSNYEFSMYGIRDGLDYPDGIADPQAREGVGQILAALAFLAAEVIDVEASRIPRPERRAIKKANQPEPAPVSVVRLRRASQTTEPQTSDSAGSKYSTRWLVSGHLRNQWYPSLGRHKLIYIPPHIKGPEGAPLNESRPTVRVVRR